MGPSITVDVDAAPDRTWAVMIDVARWPEWTDSVTTATPLDAGPLGVGSRVRLEQPRLRPAVWTVTEFSPVDRFVWTSRSPGLAISAAHRVTPSAAGSRATLSIDVGGLLAPVVSRLYGRLMERYLAMEAAGLKARSERSDR